MELTVEKSEEQAEVIKMIGLMVVSQLDIDYCKELVKGMHRQANFQDSAAVLNRNYNPDDSNLIRLQGNALMKLVEYVETLKSIDEMKNKIRGENKSRDEISNLFMQLR